MTRIRIRITPSVVTRTIIVRTEIMNIRISSSASNIRSSRIHTRTILEFPKTGDPDIVP